MTPGLSPDYLGSSVKTSQSGKIFAILPAAGLGVRFGGSTRKQYLTLEGKSLLRHSVDAFLATGLFKTIVVCLPPDEIDVIAAQGFGDSVKFVAGGATRMQSVHNGFLSLDADDNDFVLVHDAVRPLVEADLIGRVAKALQSFEAVVPAVPLADTIKEISGNQILKTHDRSRLRAIQTPQGFSCGLLKKVYKSLPSLAGVVTDEAMLVEQAGFEVNWIEGNPSNIKVTTPLDLQLAEVFYKRKP